MANFLNLIAWVRRIPSLFPGISRVSIDLTLLMATDRLWVEAFFTHTEIQSSGLFVTPFRAGTSHIVVESFLGPFLQDPLPQPRHATRTERLKAGWDKFLRYASCHLNH
jgi:hypothetical protein